MIRLRCCVRRGCCEGCGCFFCLDFFVGGVVFVVVFFCSVWWVVWVVCGDGGFRCAGRVLVRGLGWWCFFRLFLYWWCG